jgi:hypothetical protein
VIKPLGSVSPPPCPKPRCIHYMSATEKLNKYVSFIMLSHGNLSTASGVQPYLDTVWTASGTRAIACGNKF